jgi:hypothetical protein
MTQDPHVLDTFASYDKMVQGGPEVIFEHGLPLRISYWKADICWFVRAFHSRVAASYT